MYRSEKPPFSSLYDPLRSGSKYTISSISVASPVAAVEKDKSWRCNIFCRGINCIQGSQKKSFGSIESKRSLD